MTDVLISRHTQITEATIAELVDRFYARARAHERLGPVFVAAVHDWPRHMSTLYAFWSSIMLRSGRYKGSPFVTHATLALDASLFGDWLVLWQETTAELFVPEVAAQFDEKAQRMADSLKAGLLYDPRKADPRQPVS
ncbi:hypothetical protein GCM10007301_41050 [Azorhizobium oxalatiphilum]|uniref:Hemoglobin n=1 Tax=Azorhizobium oxalatiphilum TaxID=980631 RepID=A0A917C8C1_9HYPH|nr:group III truncated hemoglobin [Azorhizobium oxalatiphilum]GGF76931.1 hypothetical protein GCM10007301_41050 [Azorhizobium oxalatiphilum]